MATIETAALDVVELVRILRGIDPAALLVAPRVLRRVIRHDRGWSGFGPTIPHHKSYVISKAALLQIATPHELGISPCEEIPGRLMLLERPDPQRLNQLTTEQALVKYWRMLFHARIDSAMALKLADGTLGAEEVQQRISRLGAIQFDEITLVLRQERFLLPPETSASIYAEFVAVYSTLRQFSPQLLGTFFPGVQDWQAVEEVTRLDVDSEAIFATTSPPGAPDPGDSQSHIALAIGKTPTMTRSSTRQGAARLGEWKIRRLEERARKLDGRGNNVRAAVFRARAAEGAGRPLEEGQVNLTLFIERLQSALDLSESDVERWRRVLLALLGWACESRWSQEGRLLYDLQKVCVDSEKGIYTFDLVGWALSLGHTPIRRPLPAAQAVAVVQHLRSALKRMRYIRLGNDEKLELAQLMEHALKQREPLLRERFRPLMESAFLEAELQPTNIPEEVAASKLIEELLDRVVEHGHLQMGHVRDAISRNQLKLSDLTLAEFGSGDALLRLNSNLAASLDGAYRKGEIYLRSLQRLSSVFFGTPVGRLITRFALLPVAAAFVTLMLILELAHLFHWQVPGVSKGAQFPPLWQVGLLSVFFLFLFQVPPFRRGVWRVARFAWDVLFGLLIDVPVRFVRHPAVCTFLESAPVQFFRRVFLRPTVYALLAAGAAYLLDPQPDAPTMVVSAVAIFALAVILAFTRLGRQVEETVSDWAVTIWQRGLVELAVAVVGFFLDTFKLLLEWLEQGLYSVDEWLRFRPGENRFLLVAKGVLSLLWGCVTYVFRFTIIVLIEPQINPIKHFPVVTVAHKVMLALVPFFAERLANWLEINPASAGFIVLCVIWLIPGVFGFAVWELKENWKLYRANRRRYLGPIAIGSHGETMLRLLRPGFHSGTIPKLYRKLRAAEQRQKKWAARNATSALHHVQDTVEHFFEREFLALLGRSKDWERLALEVGHVHLATNRIMVELVCPTLEPRPLVLAFDHQAGWLLAETLTIGWLHKLTPRQRRALEAALAGVYKMAGVDMTREQIGKILGRPEYAINVSNEGLVVRMTRPGSPEAVYDLTQEPVLRPRVTIGNPQDDAFVCVETRQILFTDVPITWNDWVMTWDQDQMLEGSEPRSMEYAVLP